jgi:hypothetical protein
MVDRALEDGRRAAELGCEEAYRLQAWIHDGRGEFDEALRCVDELLQKFPAAAIPAMPDSYAHREREFARLEAERAAHLEREAERLALEAERHAFWEENRLRQEAEAKALASRGQKKGFWDLLNDGFARLDAGGGGGSSYDFGSQANWNAGLHLQQRLNEEAQHNARCHELERRFGSGAADLERSLWRP